MKTLSVVLLVLPGTNVSSQTDDKKYNSPETTKAINIKINSQDTLAVYFRLCSFKFKLLEDICSSQSLKSPSVVSYS